MSFYLWNLKMFKILQQFRLQHLVLNIADNVYCIWNYNNQMIVYYYYYYNIL